MRQKTVKKLLDKVIEDYDNIADEFDQTRKNQWPEFSSTLPYIKDGQTILDIGCGNGRFFDFIKKSFKIKYLGIDKSRKLIEKAVKSYEGPNAHFTEGDALNLPIENQIADITVCFAVLHHIPTKDLRAKAVQEMHRVVKKNGILIITVWNLFQKKYKKYIWKARLKAFFCLRSKYSNILFDEYGYRDTFIPWGNSGIKRYYYAFKAKELKKLLVKNNFKILEESVGNNIMFICQKV